MMLWEDWERINWLSRYKDASFNINVKMHIRRTGLIIRTSPISQAREELLIMLSLGRLLAIIIILGSFIKTFSYAVWVWKQKTGLAL